MNKHTLKLPAGFLGLLQRKRYSQSTVNTYINYFQEFMQYFINEDLNKISYQQINDYILELIQHKKISVSQ